MSKDLFNLRSVIKIIRVAFPLQKEAPVRFDMALPHFFVLVQ